MRERFDSRINDQSGTHANRRDLIKGAGVLALTAFAMGTNGSARAQTPVADPVTAAAVDAYLYGY